MKGSSFPRGQKGTSKVLIVEAAKQSGNVSYLKGTLGLGNKLFVKRVPVDWSKIVKVYRDCAHIANVVSLRSFEQDDQFAYIAFEETTSNDGMIKLCGMGKSERIPKLETAAALAYICKGDALMAMEQYDVVGDSYSMALHLDPYIL
ncbi:hypothetical protein Tco_1353679 [Tanacetum coccineum]